MTADKYEALGPALARIGEEAVRVVGGDPDGIYLYVEAGEGWVGTSLYKEDAHSLTYVNVGDNIVLDNLITSAWYIEPADKRWTAMQYIISQGKFDASFEFDKFDHLERDKNGLDHRDRTLRARFGDKPIVYPPLPSRATRLSPPS